jgi:hypothetical protein
MCDDTTQLPNPLYIQTGDTQQPLLKYLGKALRDSAVHATVTAATPALGDQIAIGLERIVCGLADAGAELSVEFRQRYPRNLNPTIAALDAPAALRPGERAALRLPPTPRRRCTSGPCCATTAAASTGARRRSRSGPDD